MNTQPIVNLAEKIPPCIETVLMGAARHGGGFYCLAIHQGATTYQEEILKEWDWLWSSGMDYIAAETFFEENKDICSLAQGETVLKAMEKCSQEIVWALIRNNITENNHFKNDDLLKPAVHR